MSTPKPDNYYRMLIDGTWFFIQAKKRPAYALTWIDEVYPNRRTGLVIPGLGPVVETDYNATPTLERRVIFFERRKDAAAARDNDPIVMDLIRGTYIASVPLAERKLIKLKPGEQLDRKTMRAHKKTVRGTLSKPIDAKTVERRRSWATS